MYRFDDPAGNEASPPIVSGSPIHRIAEEPVLKHADLLERLDRRRRRRARHPVR